MTTAADRPWWRRAAHRLREKGVRYWLVSLAILLALVLGQPVIEQRLNLADARNALFLLLSRSVTNPSTPHNVKLVWIGDDEYWGPMAGRSPTDRHYLAKLIRAADAADASAIALDFDLELPVATRVTPGDYGVVPAPYRAETDDLIRTIGEVAQRRRIILSRTIAGPVDGPFMLVPDTWGAYGICTRMRPHGQWDNPGTAEFPLTPVAQRRIACGYIALMTDKRAVPHPAHIGGEAALLDPFALAIARTRDPAAPERVEGGHYYASYVPEAALHAPTMAMSAHDLLAQPARAADLLQGFPVIIAAAWHLDAHGTGERVDTHDTPIGHVAGALIHANIAEAVLSNRIYPALPHAAMLGIEIALGLGAAILFALMRSAAKATALLVAAMPALLLVQWLSLQLFGTFLDLFMPVVGLGLHAIADRLVNGAETAEAE